MMSHLDTPSSRYHKSVRLLRLNMEYDKDRVSFGCGSEK